MTMTIRIAVAQLRLSTNSPGENLGRANSAIQAAATNGAQLVVLPELTNSGYAFTSVEEARANCWELDGPEIQSWIDLAHALKVVLVAGVGIRDGDRLLNCSIIIDSTGIRGLYEKAHLWGDEPDFFARGNTLPLVVDTSIGRVATMVCYDVEFPEWVRIAMLDGAQILALPTNWPDTGIPASPTPMEVVRVQAAASQNKLIIAAADRTGEENGITWVSASAIVDYNGLIQSRVSGPNEEIIYADLELPDDDSIGPRNSIKKDRRSDLYSRLDVNTHNAETHLI